MSVSYGGDSITFADSSVVGSGWTGFKNKIINGAMTVSQRYGTSGYSGGGGGWGVDRFYAFNSIGDSFSAKHLTTNPPKGFSHYYAITATTARTLSSGDYFLIDQVIEGYNVADLNWGTSDAAPVTLSFWVKTSNAGTYSICLGDLGSNNYVSSYSIPVANTWTKISITVPGPTSSSPLASLTNGVGLGVRFHMQLGASASGSLNTWGTGWNATSSASVGTGLFGTVGNYFYLTGVQLEKGSAASSFEYRSYAQEISLCMRYFERIQYYERFYGNYSGSSFTAFTLKDHPFKVPKRNSSYTVYSVSDCGDYAFSSAAGTGVFFSPSPGGDFNSTISAARKTLDNVTMTPSSGGPSNGMTGGAYTLWISNEF